MAKNKYYPEEVLVEKVQKGEYGWLDYVNHHSAEWQEEYTQYCLGQWAVHLRGKRRTVCAVQGQTIGRSIGTW